MQVNSLLVFCDEGFVEELTTKHYAKGETMASPFKSSISNMFDVLKTKHPYNARVLSL